MRFQRGLPQGVLLHAAADSAVHVEDLGTANGSYRHTNRRSRGPLQGALKRAHKYVFLVRFVRTSRDVRPRAGVAGELVHVAELAEPGDEFFEAFCE